MSEQGIAEDIGCDQVLRPWLPVQLWRHPWVSMILQVWILHQAELILSQMSSHRASVAQEMWPDLKHSPLFPALCLQEAPSHRTVRDHYRAERCHLLRIHLNIVIL